MRFVEKDDEPKVMGKRAFGTNANIFFGMGWLRELRDDEEFGPKIGVWLWISGWWVNLSIAALRHELVRPLRRRRRCDESLRSSPTPKSQGDQRLMDVRREVGFEFEARPRTQEEWQALILDKSAISTGEDLGRMGP